MIHSELDGIATLGTEQNATSFGSLPLYPATHEHYAETFKVRTKYFHVRGREIHIQQSSH